MKTKWKLFWIGKEETNIIEGQTLVDAWTNAGYTYEDIAKLDHWEVTA